MLLQCTVSMESAIGRLYDCLQEIDPLVASLVDVKKAIDGLSVNCSSEDIELARETFSRIKVMADEIIMIDPEDLGNALVHKIAANISKMAKDTMVLLGREKRDGDGG